MLKNIKNSLFYIGIIIFSITLFLGEIDVTCFFKGFACGLEIIGAIVLIKNSKISNIN